MRCLSRHSSRTVVPSASESIDLRRRRPRRRARRSTRGCRAGRAGTRSRSKPGAGVAHRRSARRRVGAAVDRRPRVPTPPACCSGVRDRLRRGEDERARDAPGHRRRGRLDRCGATCTSTPSSSAARSMSSATLVGIPRLVAALLRVLLGVRQSGERLAGHRDGERALARRLARAPRRSAPRARCRA